MCNSDPFGNHKNVLFSTPEKFSSSYTWNWNSWVEMLVSMEKSKEIKKNLKDYI